jgi:hypothetical protein
MIVFIAPSFIHCRYLTLVYRRRSSFDRRSGGAELESWAHDPVFGIHMELFY